MDSRRVLHPVPVRQAGMQPTSQITIFGAILKKGSGVPMCDWQAVSLALHDADRGTTYEAPPLLSPATTIPAPKSNPCCVAVQSLAVAAAVAAALGGTGTGLLASASVLKPGRACAPVAYLRGRRRQHGGSVNEKLCAHWTLLDALENNGRIGLHWQKGGHVVHGRWHGENRINNGHFF